MMRALIALTAGTLFGAGLAWSGMADPMRVRGFLDLFGPWDPTLAFVIGGATIPMAMAWVAQGRMSKPFADVSFDLPATARIDRKLAVGAILFGIGWGISGLCPGPAIADLSIAPGPAMVFVAALFGGIALHRFTA